MWSYIYMWLITNSWPSKKRFAPYNRPHLTKLDLFDELNCYFSIQHANACVCQTHKRCELRFCQAAASAIYQSPLSKECSARRGKQILSQMRPPLCFCNLIRTSISPIVSGFSTFAGVATHESPSADELLQRSFCDFKRTAASAGASLSNYTCGSRH